MKKIFLLTFLVFSLIIPAKSTHVVGGNLVVTQTGPNQYSIVCKVYRDCALGNAPMPTDVTVGIYYANNNNLHNSIIISNPVTSTVTLGDNCYTPTGICLQEGIFTANNINIPDNAAGFYLQTQLFARNGIIVNIFDPGGTGMSFYAEIPNPALAGMNASPDFGPYPSDGYLCINNLKEMDFSVTDADGDSLAYSLVEPLQSNGTNNGTSPAPYTPVVWQAPYSFTNIVGGAPAMSCDPITGIVSAAPTAIGTYVFAVRIEEFRNGIKIGEVRRDVQYHALNCVFDDLPEIQLPDTLAISVGSTGCFDIVVLDADATDSISIYVTSPTFANGATLGMPPIPVTTTPDTTYEFFYTDEITGQLDSVILNAPDFINGAFYGVGGIGLQYCWETSCEDIVNSPFILDVEAFSLGCSGDTNFINQTVELHVVPPQLPVQEIYLPDTIVLVARDATCFDLVVLTQNPDDTLNIFVSSATLFAGASLQYPNPITTNPNTYEFFYWNPATTDLDSIILEEPTFSNGIYSGIGGVGLSYCWITECGDIAEGLYDIEITSFIVGCLGDTTFLSKNTFIEIKPPVGMQTIVPNVFTPNGDGINDDYRIMGISNYCYDTLTIKIYDRWGKLTFESADPEFVWDGKNMNGNETSEGTYYVIINGIFGDTDVTRQYPLTLLRKEN
jgi:gliding motility-associated-like protein